VIGAAAPILPDEEPYRVSFTPEGVEIVGRISDPRSADELIATISALKLLLKPASVGRGEQNEEMEE